MAQTIRLTYEAGLEPTLKLFDSAGDAVGEAAGYALTEVSAGEYQTSVADGLSGSPLVAVLEVGGSVEATDYVWLSGVANSVAIIGVQNVDLAPALSAIGNVPTAEQIGDRIERQGGSLDLLRQLSSEGFSETIARLDAVPEPQSAVQITVTVKSSGNDAGIGGAKVTLWQQGNSQSRTAGSEGIVPFVVDDNTEWIAYSTAAGHLGGSRQVVVNGSDNYDLTLEVRSPLRVDPPVSYATCQSSLIAETSEGDPADGLLVTVTPRERFIFVGDTLVHLEQYCEVTDNGTATVNLHRKQWYSVAVREPSNQRQPAEWQFDFFVPDEESAIIRKLTAYQPA